MSLTFPTLIGTALLLTSTATAASPAPAPAPAPAPTPAPASSTWELDRWPEASRQQITDFLDQASQAPDVPYAVFDADNTLWQHDLEESLMPFLEQKGLLSLESLDKAIRPLPILQGESLWNYYLRLCEVDDGVCYLWIAQVFSGIKLATLRENIHELLSSEEPITTTYLENGEVRTVEIRRPKVFAAQAQLIRAMRKAGIDVWVVSAALEELVRMVASDPRYGLNVVPEHVIGVNLLMNTPEGELRLSSHDRASLKGNAAYFDAARMECTLTPHLLAPATWYQGKVAGIRTWIEPTKDPIFVAGDAVSDLAMLFETDVESGGMRVWVRRKDSYFQRASATAEERGERLDAEHGWLVVVPTDLHTPPK
jgi:phosphoserine phosphatase